ncbi:MAG: DUF4271 domain-containing protein [Bacteroidales bacterium]|nr:DUF4271 domain-containing protein [Bacteroidales bacterium]
MTQDTSTTLQNIYHLKDTFVVKVSLLSSDSLQAKKNNIQSEDTIIAKKSDSVVTQKNLKKFITIKENISREFVPYKIKTANNDWILGVIIICVTLYTFAHAFYHKRIIQIYSAFVGRHFANQLNREGNLFNDRISIPLFIVFILSFSLFLTQSFIYFVDEDKLFFQGHVYYLIICLLLTVYWFGKTFLILLFSKIFRTEKTTKEYLLNMLIFTAVTGVVILPINILIIYLNSDLFIYIGIVITYLILAFWLIRGFIIGLSYKNYSYLHLFIYLCSLEILPLIVLTKMVIKNYFLY